MAFALVANLSNTVFLTTPLSTTLRSLHKSGGPVPSLSICILSISVFKDTMKVYFCYCHTLLYTTTLSSLFYLF